MPRNADGRFRYVYRIEEHGSWHYRAVVTFGRSVHDYGTFCEEGLAAFVANYGRVHTVKTREMCWEEIGIVNIDDLPSDCLDS